MAEARAYQALSGGVITQPQDVVDLLRSAADKEEQEVFWVLVLDIRNQVRALVEVCRGTINSTLVHPREVFRLAIAWGGSALLVAHNHPSGDPSPSPEDRSVTRQLVAAGFLLDIPVLDHLILAGDRYFSFQESGTL